MAMTYATVCSGVEGCSLALDGMGWQPVFFSEIEPFPCAVLKAHNQLVLTSPTAYIVRRLTPTECERLMGYPDHYTIPTGLQITDALVEEFQEIFANFAAIMEPDKPVKRKSDKQIRAWLEKVANPETCPDAPRYKCCGNGWAINSARWVLQGIDRFLRK